MYGLAVHLTGNPDDAQDLAQEAFVRAYRSIGSFRFQSDFGTWMHRITVNTWINMTRKQKGIYLESLDQEIEGESSSYKKEVASDDVGPDQAFERQEFQGMVRKALLELNEEHRTVLVMREIYGYSYDEIAASTESSLGTVKSRINRAKSNLRKKILELSGKYDFPFARDRKAGDRQ
ncbi:RNA polymerase sigma-24 [Heliorestis convoluta]|uniref:RNA polymerase sigma-24 n=1 Tax=Heliorestis convoluta TaxID=356322 RepID=A0A5Q2MXE6_9FIRM|nr:RNA polymerase sigma-24 [Heliorestis convoluta]